MQCSYPGLLNLPAELVLHIFCLLDPEDIVAVRQTCTALYSFEKSFHEPIWRGCLQELTLHSALFPPAFRWKSLSPNGGEMIARRAASMESILSRYQDEGKQDPIPSESFDLNTGISGDCEIHSVFLVPGGRFLLLMSETLLQVWDFGPYLASHTLPVLAASFSIPFCVLAHPFTMAGCETTSIRILLLHEPQTPEARKKYGINQDECLNYYFLYELSFEEATLRFTKIGELPLICSEDSWEDLCTITESCVGLLLGLDVVVWNFVENTCIAWRIEDDDEAVMNEGIISQGHISFCRMGRMVVIFEIPPLKPLSSDGMVIRLSSLLASQTVTQSRIPLPGYQDSVDGFSPFSSSPASWGIMNSSNPVVPVWEYREGPLYTRWVHISKAASSTVPAISMVALSEHRIPTLDVHKWTCETTIGRLSNRNVVTSSLWLQLTPSVLNEDIFAADDIAIFASIAPRASPNSQAPSDHEPENVLTTKSSLIPLTKCKDDAVAWDFCPLSGLMVMSSSDPVSSTTRTNRVVIYDFFRPHVRA